MRYRIRELRERSGMTQAELARKAGIIRGTLIRLENEQGKDPRVSTLRCIAMALEVPLRELFEEEAKT